jgi:hypothetical protein
MARLGPSWDASPETASLATPQSAGDENGVWASGRAKKRCVIMGVGVKRLVLERGVC